MELPVSSIKKTIVMDPIASGKNQYVQIVASLLGKNHNLVSLGQALRATLSLKRNNTVAILNWFETKFNYSRVPVLGFFKSVAILLFLKVTCSKIVWVKHNHKPHENQNTLFRWLTIWMEAFLSWASTDVITHDYVTDLASRVVPHPLYLRAPMLNTSSDRDIDFLIFGQVKRYKNMDRLLSRWPQAIPLTLVGKAESQELRDELNAIIKNRALAVDWDDRFIPDEELNDLLQRSKFAILPHSEDSMIVSGAFYHAITYGCNLVMADNAFARHMQSRHSFCHREDDSQPLETQLKRALSAYVNHQVVIQQAFEHYSDKQVLQGFNAAITGYDCVKTRALHSD